MKKCIKGGLAVMILSRATFFLCYLHLCIVNPSVAQDTTASRPLGTSVGQQIMNNSSLFSTNATTGHNPPTTTITRQPLFIWSSNKAGLFSQYLQAKLAYNFASQHGRTLHLLPFSSTHFSTNSSSSAVAGTYYSLCDFLRVPPDVKCGRGYLSATESQQLPQRAAVVAAKIRAAASTTGAAAVSCVDSISRRTIDQYLTKRKVRHADLCFNGSVYALRGEESSKDLMVTLVNYPGFPFIFANRHLQYFEVFRSMITASTSGGIINSSSGSGSDGSDGAGRNVVVNSTAAAVGENAPRQLFTLSPTTPLLPTHPSPPPLATTAATDRNNINIGNNNNTYIVVHWRRGDQLSTRCARGEDQSVNCANNATALIERIEQLVLLNPLYKDAIVYVATNEQPHSPAMKELHSAGLLTYSSVMQAQAAHGADSGTDSDSEKKVKNQFSVFQFKLPRLNAIETYLLEARLMLDASAFYGIGFSEVNFVIERERMLRGKSYCFGQTEKLKKGEFNTWCSKYGKM